MEPTRARLLALATTLAAGLALVLGLTACGDDTLLTGSSASTDSAAPTSAPSTTVAPPAVVLRYVTTGGCVVMGPNCPTYVVWSDGKVEISRTDVDGPAEITGTIPASAVQDWFASVQSLDLAALTAEVGPGSCNSCVDGADITATVELPSGPVVLDSTKLAFDPANTTFAALDRLITQVRAVGELPLRTGN